MTQANETARAALCFLSQWLRKSLLVGTIVLVAQDSGAHTLAPSLSPDVAIAISREGRGFRIETLYFLDSRRAETLLGESDLLRDIETGSKAEFLGVTLTAALVTVDRRGTHRPVALSRRTAGTVLRSGSPLDDDAQRALLVTERGGAKALSQLHRLWTINCSAEFGGLTIDVGNSLLAAGLNITTEGMIGPELLADGTRRWVADDKGCASASSAFQSSRAQRRALFAIAAGDYRQSLAGAYDRAERRAEPGSVETRRLVQRLSGPAERIDSTKAVSTVLEWISNNVQYQVRRLGAPESFAMRTPDETIRRKTGDCKDLALLLKVMLDAFGLDSRSVIVSTEHELDMSTPAKVLVNHVITYVPSLDAYVDATVASYGLNSAAALIGHPTIHVAPFRLGRVTLADASYHTSTQVELAPGEDGAALSSAIRSEFVGIASVFAQGVVESIGKVSVKAKQGAFRKEGWQLGKFVVTGEATRPGAYRATVNVEARATGDSIDARFAPSALQVSWLYELSSLLASVKGTHEFKCLAPGTYSETVKLRATLGSAYGLVVGASHLEAGHLRFSSECTGSAATGQQCTRELVSSSTQIACSAEDEDSYAKIAQEIEATQSWWGKVLRQRPAQRVGESAARPQ